MSISLYFLNSYNFRPTIKFLGSISDQFSWGFEAKLFLTILYDFW